MFNLSIQNVMDSTFTVATIWSTQILSNGPVTTNSSCPPARTFTLSHALVWVVVLGSYLPTSAVLTRCCDLIDGQGYLNSDIAIGETLMCHRSPGVTRWTIRDENDWRQTWNKNLTPNSFFHLLVHPCRALTGAYVVWRSIRAFVSLPLSISHAVSLEPPLARLPSLYQTDWLCVKSAWLCLSPAGM